MEYVDAILYHKIMDSDFTNMYGVKRPGSGGGQTYVQAAGFSEADLAHMFQFADRITPTKESWAADPAKLRSNYVFVAYEIGTSASAMLEFAPRTGRRDYRIARQSIKDRHPEWSVSSGFPEPRKAADGITYLAEKNYPGLIDDLYIFIVRTYSTDGRHIYYASYTRSSNIPDEWPENVGLEAIFHSQTGKQGILFFDHQFLRFQNNRRAPFVPGSAIDEMIGKENLPTSTIDSAIDAATFAAKDIDLSMNIDSLSFKKVSPPAPLKRPRKHPSTATVQKGRDFLQSGKNNKIVGDTGEKLVVELERRRLISLGYPDAASEVVHVSKDIGDGLGYDIESYDLFDGKLEKVFIEVKSTTGGIGKPFIISANEVEVSRAKQSRYYLYRLFALCKGTTEVLYYVQRGEIEECFRLTPTAYQAVLK